MTLLKFKRLHGNYNERPQYATKGAAGMDIYASQPMTVPPGRSAKIATGWAVEIPEGFELQCRSRSGLAANKGLFVLNSPGTIDSDYRGELMVILHNTSDITHQIEIGDRVAQLVLAPVVRAEIMVVDVLSETERGEGGFGSTGR